MLAALLLATTIVIEWKPAQLTPAQARWLEELARTPNDAHIQSAREAGLNSTADYLEAVASGNAAAAHEAWRKTITAPVQVLVNSKDSEVIAGVRVDDDVWLAESERRLAEFEKTLPGYRADWDRRRPHVEHVIADLVFRSGPNNQSTASGSFPPFDPALRSQFGRSYVHWRNMMRANWLERQIQPAVAPLHLEITPEAHLRFYASRFLMYDIGPSHVGGRDLAEVLGDARNALVIAKADILPALFHDWRTRGKTRKADLRALTAMSFFALNDPKAPPPHKPASSLVLNWTRRHGGMSIRALRALVGELLEIESTGDRVRAERLLAEYGQITPEIKAALDKMPSPQVEKATVVYRILGARPSRPQ